MALPRQRFIAVYKYKHYISLKVRKMIIDPLVENCSRPGVTNRSVNQRGATLIELMVGIAVGLLVVAVAAASLMVSRGVSGTVTDASQLQQQASYAFRVLGQQIRQSASMRLDLAANKTASEIVQVEDVVAFSPDPQIFTGFADVPATTPAISGKETPTVSQFKLSVAYQNYREPSFPSGTDESFVRDCLGAEPSPTIVQSQFVLRAGELRCAGADNVAQALIRNVAEFQVRYLVQNRASAISGTPTIQYLSADSVPVLPATGTPDWSSVFGVEICLVLYGDERVDMPVGSTYVSCDGVTTPDMTSAGSLPAEQKNRLHTLFRSVYQVRSQGLAG